MTVEIKYFQFNCKCLVIPKRKLRLAVFVKHSWRKAVSTVLIGYFKTLYHCCNG